MSFSLSVPPAESTVDFEDKVIAAKASPRADARTKAGKRQNALVESGKEALINLADDLDIVPTGGYVSGHVNVDGSYNIGVGVSAPPE